MPFADLSSVIASDGRMKIENGKEITKSMETKLSELRSKRKIK